MNLTTLQYKTYVGVAFAAVISSVPLAFILPVEVSFENGLIENAQVIVLLISAVLMLNTKSPMKWFRRFFAAGLILIAFRELSWGRVFFPIAMEAFGPVFIDMADYEYRTLVYVFLAAYISAMLFILIRFVPVKKILSSRQPVAAFALMIMAALFSSIGDHGWLIGKAHGQILEEFNELILYMTLPVVGLYYCRTGTKKIF